MADTAKLTRILVANTPRLMRDAVVATFAGQPDIEIVGEVAEAHEILAKIRATVPDILVVDLDDTERRPAICDQVLGEYPALSVIAVASRKDLTICYWSASQIHSQEIEASPEGLLDAVRKTATLRTDPGRSDPAESRIASTAN